MDGNRGIFLCENKSIVLRKWQILEFDDKPYYAYVPESEFYLAENTLPEYHEIQENNNYANKSIKIEFNTNDELSDNCSIDNQELAYNKQEEIEEEFAEQEEYTAMLDKGLINANGSNKENEGDSFENLYQLKVDGSMVTIEKLDSNNPDSNTFSEADENEIEKNGENVESEEELFDSFIEDDESSDSKINHSPNPFQESENTSIILKCKACSETFSSNLAFKKHVACTHKKKVCIHENGAYICSVCDYWTLKKSLFAAHLERKHGTWTDKQPNNLIYPCAACGFVCRSKHSLQSHFTRKHTDKYEHQCKFCTKQFKVKGDLTNHVRFHHKEKPISCDVCGKICQNTGSLYVHQKWAHYKPKYECHICHRRMVTQKNLDQHLISQHEKREKIVCAECGKTFTKKDSFKRHMAVHTGSKPHSCMICNKPFARRSQLRQHLLIHTGKKPFICEICGKGFTQKPGLICHRKIHPGIHPRLPVMPIADLVKDLTKEFNFEQENEDIQDTPDDPEFLDREEILAGPEILESDEILESQEVFYEQEMQDDQDLQDHQGYHVDQQFLNDQQFHATLEIEQNHEIVESQVIEIGP